MASRKMMLGLSVLIALAFHGGMFAAAPRIAILRPNATAEQVKKLFKVDIYTEETPLDTQKKLPEQTLSSKPGSVSDLLARETKELEPRETIPDKPRDVPSLAARAGAETIERTHELEQNTAALEQIDARIIEISQNAARENVQIARRLVRPSSTRILAEGEFPTLRSTEERVAAPVGSFGGLTSPLGGERTAEETPARPTFESGVLNPESENSGLPDLPIETITARSPIQEAIREKSPYEIMDDLVRIEVETYIPEDDAQGFYRLRIVPRETETIAVLPKDVTFVIDASNSIIQRKLDLTASGIRQCVIMLQPTDRFNIVVFRDTATLFRPELDFATPETKQDALDFLETLKSRGSTDVYNAMGPVIQRIPRPGVANMVVVTSDGRPSTGNLSGRDLINSLTDLNIHRTPIYAYSGGKSVNQYLLDLLAYRNKGQARIAPRVEDIRAGLPNFFTGFNEPILAELSADYGRSASETVFPKELPDFYRGRVVTVYGRFSPETDEYVVMRLKGTAGDRKKELIFRRSLKDAPKGGPEIAKNWAFEKTYYLIGEICRLGDTPDLLNEVRQLGDRYDVKTSYYR